VLDGLLVVSLIVLDVCVVIVLRGMYLKVDVRELSLLVIFWVCFMLV